MAQNDAAFGHVADQIRHAVDIQALGIPARHGALPSFRRLVKGINFNRERDMDALMSVMACLCIYDRLDRAIGVGLALREVPKEPPRPYNPISAGMSTIACFAERAGDPNGPALREATLNPIGGPMRRGPKALDGSMLIHVLDGDRWLDTPNVRAGYVLMDIMLLSGMWIFGSTNPEWDLERIGSQIDRYVAGIKEIRNWGPWTSE